MGKKSILKAPFERQEIFCTQKATDNSSKYIYSFLHPEPTIEDRGWNIRRVCSASQKCMCWGNTATKQQLQISKLDDFKNNLSASPSPDIFFLF